MPKASRIEMILKFLIDDMGFGKVEDLRHCTENFSLGFLQGIKMDITIESPCGVNIQKDRVNTAFHRRNSSL